MSTPAAGRSLIVIALLLAPAASVAAGKAGAVTRPLPGTLTAHREAWRALLRWPASCDDGGKTRPWMGWEGNAGVGVERPFRSGLRLVQVACFGGAYQAYFLLYLIDRDRRVTGPLVLPIYVESSNLLGLHVAHRAGQRLDRPTLVRQANLRGWVSTDPATGMLVVSSGGQGARGNCGFYSTFRLYGKRFVPVEARAKLDCDYKPPFGAEQWQKLPLP